MGSSDRLFNRHTTLHQILGGALFADVILWRRKDLTLTILGTTLFVRMVFERSGYTLLTFVSSVILLLLAILFLWAKSAAILNRPAPPIPHLHVSEEMVNEAAVFFGDNLNVLLSVFEDIALGRDSKVFINVAAGLSLIIVIGSLTDFLTLSYTSVVLVLTFPALYERYEDRIDMYVLLGYRKFRQLYMRFNGECPTKMQDWIMEKKKKFS